MGALNQNPSPVNQSGEPGLVSIVIPAYRARRYLPESLASIRAQTYPRWEVIIVDDCSPEPVADLVSAFAATVPHHSVRLIRHAVNQRLGGSRNTGIKAADGKFIAFLDHDDIWRENHLQDAVTALEASGADLSFCEFAIFENQPGDRPDMKTSDSRDWGVLPESLYLHNFIQPSGVVARKSVLECLGGFSTVPEIHMCEDLDLWLRVAGQGGRFTCVPKPNLLYRKHPGAATSNTARMAAAKAYTILKNLDVVPSVPSALRRRRAAEVCAEAAREHARLQPVRAAYFYWLSFRVQPWKNRRLLAAALYLGLGCLPARLRPR